MYNKLSFYLTLFLFYTTDDLIDLTTLLLAYYSTFDRFS